MGDSHQDTTSTNQSSTTPWAPQAAALQNAFTDAQSAYDKSKTATAPTNFTAGMTPDQLSTFQSMIGYGNGNIGAANSVTGAGVGNLNTGSSAAAGALNTLGAFNPSATNNIGTAVNGAQTFANGLNINGAVNAAMQPAMEQLRDVTLPGMESSAAGSGNINSSRTGIAEGIAERGLAENAQNTAATMYNNAYNTGAGIAATQSNQNNNAALQAATSQGYLGSNLGANGASQVGLGVNDATNLFTLAAGGGAGVRAGDQADLTNQLQRYEAKVSSPYDSLNALMNIIGTRMYGSNTTGSGTSNTTTTPSPLQMAGGILSMF